MPLCAHVSLHKVIHSWVLWPNKPVSVPGSQLSTEDLSLFTWLRWKVWLSLSPSIRHALSTHVPEDVWKIPFEIHWREGSPNLKENKYKHVWRTMTARPSAPHSVSSNVASTCKNLHTTNIWALTVKQEGSPQASLADHSVVSASRSQQPTAPMQPSPCQGTWGNRDGFLPLPPHSCTVSSKDKYTIHCFHIFHFFLKNHQEHVFAAQVEREDQSQPSSCLLWEPCLLPGMTLMHGHPRGLEMAQQCSSPQLKFIPVEAV